MRRIVICTSLLVCIGANFVHAQSYPVRPIRIVVGSAPGGANDFMARLVSQPMSDDLGQSVVIDNRGGAGGNVGTEIVTKSAPDGYTLLLGSTQMTVTPHLVSKMSYDILKDLTPISLVATGSPMLAIHPSIPAKTVQQLIAVAKSRKLTYASSGSGSASHLATKQLESVAGIEMIHVPYKGTGAAILDLISGQVNLIFSNKPGVMPYVLTERLRAIAVASRRRDPTLPDIPTISETFPGYESSTWWGILGPVGLSKNVVERLYASIGKANATTQVKEQMVRMGTVPASGTPDDFAMLIRQDLIKYGELVKRAGMKVD